MKRSGPIFGILAAILGLAMWLSPAASATVTSGPSPAATCTPGPDCPNPPTTTCTNPGFCPPPPGSGRAAQELAQLEQEFAQRFPALAPLVDAAVNALEHLLF